MCYGFCRLTPSCYAGVVIFTSKGYGVCNVVVIVMSFAIIEH